MFNEAAPKELLEILRLINRMMTSASEARLFFYYYGTSTAKHGYSFRANLLQEIVQEQSSLGKHFLEAMTTGLLALTYLNIFWGTDAREMLAKPEQRASQLLIIVETFERLGKLK